jgi:polyhydroxybutyrate depolymerase
VDLSLYEVFMLLSLLLFAATAQAADFQGPDLIPSGDPGRASARVYLPNAYSESDTTKLWPVIELLHGYEETQSFINLYFGLDKEVSKRGFILIVPEGLKDTNYHYWNASSACCDFAAMKVNDTKYLTDLADLVVAKYHGDKSRVTITGHSNGAFMAHRLACASSDHFAAIAAFAGMTTLNAEDCKPTSAVSLLQIDALDDETIKYNGDKGFPPLAAYPGAVESVKRWVGFNGCNGVPEKGDPLKLTLSILSTKDATSQHWTGCRNGTEVKQDIIKPWPAPAVLYHAHTPALSWGFTDEVLDFLLSKTKQVDQPASGSLPANDE